MNPATHIAPQRSRHARDVGDALTARDAVGLAVLLVGLVCVVLLARWLVRGGLGWWPRPRTPEPEVDPLGKTQGFDRAWVEKGLSAEPPKVQVRVRSGRETEPPTQMRLRHPARPGGDVP